MITAAVHAVTVAPKARTYSTDDTIELSRIAAEIGERIEEMEAIRINAGADFLCRLATVARTDIGAFRLFVAVMHGRSECLLDSYAAQADKTGRTKQTMHYRMQKHLELLEAVFPESSRIINEIRLSVKHHEDPLSKADALRGPAGDE